MVYKSKGRDCPGSKRKEEGMVRPCRSHRDLQDARLARGPARGHGVLFALSGVIMFSAAALIPVISCGNSASLPKRVEASSPSSFRIETSDFKEGETIPKKFTCEGENDSPSLRWTAPPARTRSFALILEDPDAPAGTWVHWVVYDLPATSRGLPEGVPKQGQVPGGGWQGKNDFGSVGYGGPCPPPGKAHRYFFRLYALDSTVGLKSGASKDQVLAATQRHILGEAQLMGRFGR
jgi:Raf kinase inhibitor-like YbhB/YbcL family protein